MTSILKSIFLLIFSFLFFCWSSFSLILLSPCFLSSQTDNSHVQNHHHRWKPSSLIIFFHGSHLGLLLIFLYSKFKSAAHTQNQHRATMLTTIFGVRWSRYELSESMLRFDLNLRGWGLNLDWTEGLWWWCSLGVVDGKWWFLDVNFHCFHGSLR